MALTKIPGNLIQTGAITAAALDNDAVTTAKILDANITHAKLHTSMDLTGKTVTVATAAGSTNTTAAASTAFVQQELTTLIGGAPGTLDTLNELAAAINDDSNYNTTLTTALATKLPLVGGTMTGPITMSQSGALHNQLTSTGGTSKLSIISADGASAYINYSGATNEMSAGYDRTTSQFRISNADTLSSAIRMSINSSTGNTSIAGATQDRRLTINNSQANGLQFNFDDSNAYRIRLTPYWSSSADTRLDFDVARASGATPSTIMSVGYNSNVGIGTTAPDGKFVVSNGGAEGIEFFPGSSSNQNSTQHYNRSGSAYVKNRTIALNHEWTNGATDPAMNLIPDGNSTFLIIKAKASTYNSTANLSLYGTNPSLNGGSLVSRATIQAQSDGTAFGTKLRFFTNNTSNVETKAITIDAAQKVGIGTDSPSALLHLKSTANSTGPSLIFENTNNAQSMNIDYWNNGGAVQSRIAYDEGPASWNFIPNVSTAASALHIAYNGNVGIGTTSDTSKLELYNSTVGGNTQLHIHNDKHGDAAVLRLEGKRTSLNDTAQLLFANNGSLVAKIDVLSAGDDGNIRFHTSASGTGSSIVAVASIDAAGSMTARSFLPTTGYNIEYLIVGGGGGGGTTIYDDCGGGGAGGYRSSIAGNPSANYAPPEPPLLAVVGKTYAVTVGAGGGPLGSGNTSGFDLIESKGGGRAGSHRSRGHPGGSGGGGSGFYASNDIVEAGVGYYGQGNNGGTVTNYSAAGGGGGAGAPGQGGSGSSKAGGDGVWSVVESGVNMHLGAQLANRVYRAGGGGAYAGGAGGLGGGGRGWTTGTAATAGAVNTGGGGGGNKENDSASATVGGGSGIVILKVPTSNYTGTTTGSPTVTTVGSYKILKFTSSGSYTA